ncbi:inositol phospholipid synthesis and fat-storage-inducing TM-domain-containing protein [Xylariaceae sp. FL0594]|nr:inositol phospholipid synthesis and fat-storage-inducing TM-domain-containing protein [Xylariaceae sp. FL0594]
MMPADQHSLRHRETRMGSSTSPNSPAAGPEYGNTSPSPATKRSSPFLPTPLERVLFAVYPLILVFGAFFSVLSPETRGAPFDAAQQSHVEALAPSYFARKDNIFNVLFVKRGWLWITVAFAGFVASHPAFRNTRRVAQAILRWALVTGWWIVVTQWCFGPPLIDRGFRLTGGRCRIAYESVAQGTADPREVVTAAACRHVGGRWSGGHDISGHVFLLVLGSCFLLGEVVWVIVRAGARIFGKGDDRAIVMDDGAVKGAGVESEGVASHHERHLGLGGKFAVGVAGMCIWMMLMTAMYFHTWVEKFTGLLVASIGVYSVYILPRWIPAVRGIVGLPGI